LDSERLDRAVDSLMEGLSGFTEQLAPVDVLALCQSLGLGLRVEIGSSRSHRGDLLLDSRGYSVVINREDESPAPLRAAERFTIAHEIGHYLLLQLGHPTPQRRAEYWRDERVCDDLARRLLVPFSVLETVGRLETGEDVASAVSEIIRATQVQPRVAAQALVEFTPQPIAAGWFGLDPLPRTRRTGWRFWWYTNIPSWQPSTPWRMAVRREDALNVVLAAMWDLRAGERRQLSVDGLDQAFLRRHRRASGALAGVGGTD